MTKLVSDDGRTHIESRLMRESLQDRKVLSKTDSERDLQIFPDVTLVSIGGQSIFDRGKDAILPLVEELARGQAATPQDGDRRRRRHARAPHDLDRARPRPADRRHRAARRRDGGAQRDPAQRAARQARLDADAARSLLGAAALLRRRHHADRDLASRRTTSGSRRRVEGALPMHGSDFGLFKLAEVLGMKQLIFVKDEDGLYDKDPKKHADAKKYRQDHARRAHRRTCRRSTSSIDELFRDVERRAKNLKRVVDRQRPRARSAHAALAARTSAPSSRREARR